eukprot:CAMPEP_0118693854 /NCGR_PEP_ID=MMETSP0800-20121206/12160_1 /TAXON_ID=210618 ORGANISM="Striatella unipunctata, Strain CCMP2910" /NCGR_SAMPLE_ID=MMETSP0800 /ASSEMBLY_ACC=CAM_ASM_000638 /LENGTH=439 /DNA_ID=CAMNT_0006592177 /DNA_START=80 /DNA_END=1399 /DNA_ORIENTATION=-
MLYYYVWSIACISRPVTIRAFGIAQRRPHSTRANLHRLYSSSSSSSQTTTTTTTTSTEEAASTTAIKKKIITRRILSGVQPTGSLHLGNYLGAIKQWVDFQNNPPKQEEEEEDENIEIKLENFFCVVDLHAITMPHDPVALRESTLASAALYIAAGIDPDKSKIFVQSHVAAHSELSWLLNCVTPMNWLERMIQYKDKAKKQGENVGVGLFTYPVLMAADILLYQADRVPVGEDQRQHLELARDLVRRFNDMFCKGNPFKKRCKAAGIPSRKTFTEPQAMIVSTGGGARVMSLTDGSSKMSKSDPNDGSRINILDPPKVIRDKIKRAKTDSFVGIEPNNPERPEASNLFSIYDAVQPDRSREELVEEVKDLSWGDFKPLLAEAVVAHLEPIQTKYASVIADEEYLSGVLRDGAASANEIASRTLKSTKIAMGFVVPKDT